MEDSKTKYIESSLVAFSVPSKALCSRKEHTQGRLITECGKKKITKTLITEG